MSSAKESFISEPSKRGLQKLKRAELLEIAGHYKITCSTSMKKEEIHHTIIDHLLEEEINYFRRRGWIGQNITSNIQLFADDCVLYRVSKSPQHELALQEDLTIVSKWASTWQMKFNVNKCVVLRCTRLLSSSQPTYSLESQLLQPVAEHLFLGIMLDCILSFSTMQLQKLLRPLILSQETFTNAPKLKPTAPWSVLS